MATGGSVQIVRLAEMLCEQIDRAGVTLDVLTTLLRSDYLEVGMKPLGRTRISKLLKGEDLVIHGHFAKAVIRRWAPPSQADAMWKEAQGLLEAAARRPIALPTQGKRRQPRNDPEGGIDGYQQLIASNTRIEAALAQIAELLEGLGARRWNDPDDDPEPQWPIPTSIGSANRWPDSGLSDLIADRDESLDVANVVEAFRLQDPRGERAARALRRSIDRVLDGKTTGRYGLGQVTKPEKTSLGAVVEIALCREFGLAEHASADVVVAGVPVDIKFSQQGRWLIAPSSIGVVCLLVSADDEKSTYSFGVVRITEEILNLGVGNRDGKRALTRAALEQVTWLHREDELPRNVLLHAPEFAREEILSYRSGQQRVDALFRLMQGQLISRNAVATVAMQDDYIKRVRGNGGSRSRLSPEGILVLGQYERHRHVAETLGLPVPGPGEFVSVRLVPMDQSTTAKRSIRLGEHNWVVAEEDDPVVALPEDIYRHLDPRPGSAHERGSDSSDGSDGSDA